eukprot:PITA_36365
MEEVEEVMKDMPNGKAPGPDGFTIDFFKACWEIVRLDMWEVAEDSRKSSSILKSLNSTFIALIPREEAAYNPSKFWPIALYNFLYKIISKVMANRLKPILPLIISEEQSGYVEVDLSKSYDKVSWKYLEAILEAFGFAQCWINWILALIKSPNFSILVNGAPTFPFAPSRGIRQGDPISPFLFVILMEGLSRIIKTTKERNNIKGLQPLPPCPATAHQQFPDDTMLHGTPTIREAQGFKAILNLFSEVIGMDFNLDKSSIFIFNTHLAIKKNLTAILGFRRQSLPSKYLGIPLTDKPWQKLHWEKLLSNLEEWSNHLTNRVLNFVGRLVMTKVVLQAIPQYMLSILMAPKGVLQKVKNI